jgi:hypothetical protein
MFACSESPGAQAMPYGVIDTYGKYSIVDIPLFTYDLFTPFITPAFKRAVAKS